MRVCSSIDEHDLGRQRVRRQHARRVAGVDAGLLDVLHHAADDGALAVGDAVDVDLDRVLEELVDEDGLRPGVARGLDARGRRSARAPSRVYAIIIARPPST